jgi:hypothetical protein
MSLPGHEAISERARQIWNSRGCPSGLDEEIWFEAERQLAVPTEATNAPSNPQGRGNGNSQIGTPPNDPKSIERTPQRPSENAVPPPAGDTPEKIAQQRKRSRAPEQPRRKGA